MLDDPGPDAFVHAAGVRVAGRLVLLVGASGSGKSTLAARLLRRGHPILGDDVVRFAPGEGAFAAVPRSLKLDPAALEGLGLGDLAARGPEAGTLLAAGALYASPAALRADWEAAPGRPWGVVVLGDAPHAGRATLARRGEGGAAVRLLQGVLGATPRGERTASADVRLRLLESVAGAVAFEAGGGDPARLADLIVEAART